MYLYLYKLKPFIRYSLHTFTIDTYYVIYCINTTSIPITWLTYDRYQHVRTVFNILWWKPFSENYYLLYRICVMRALIVIIILFASLNVHAEVIQTFQTH